MADSTQSLSPVYAQTVRSDAPLSPREVGYLQDRVAGHVRPTLYQPLFSAHMTYEGPSGLELLKV